MQDPVLSPGEIYTKAKEVVLASGREAKKAQIKPAYLEKYGETIHFLKTEGYAYSAILDFLKESDPQVSNILEKTAYNKIIKIYRKRSAENLQRDLRETQSGWDNDEK